jgi:hypothetical protein
MNFNAALTVSNGKIYDSKHKCRASNSPATGLFARAPRAVAAYDRSYLSQCEVALYRSA